MAPPMATPFISVTDTQGFVDIEPHRRYDNGHPNSPWRRIAIIPIWVLGLIILALNVVIVGMIIGITKSGSGPGKNQAQPWTVLNMVFATIALVITCAEVMVFVYNELTPKVFLWSNVFKLAIGLAPIGYQISVTQTSWIKQPLNKTYIAVAFGFSAAAYLVYIAALGYAVYVFTRVRNHMKGLHDSYSGDSEATRLTHAYS